ncbi:hypothetical protein J6590_043866 [Homalodisca vitripennis]|nr:hypothetical protein J6590_043866 [Homalodisca vitripennis]
MGVTNQSAQCHVLIWSLITNGLLSEPYVLYVTYRCRYRCSVEAMADSVHYVPTGTGCPGIARIQQEAGVHPANTSPPPSASREPRGPSNLYKACLLVSLVCLVVLVGLVALQVVSGGTMFPYHTAYHDTTERIHYDTYQPDKDSKYDRGNRNLAI